MCQYFIQKLKRFCKSKSILNSSLCYRHSKITPLSEKPDECIVCLETLDDKDHLQCGHYIHRECIIKTGKNKCPMCRANVKLDKKEAKECEKYELKYRRELDTDIIIPTYFLSPPITVEWYRGSTTNWFLEISNTIIIGDL